MESGPRLPCTGTDIVTLGEGQTPLLSCPRIGSSLGTTNLFLKDESRNPTWSYKDRFSTVAVSIARAQGAKVVATASSGNAGASLAAYAARADMDCVVATFAGMAGAMLSQIRKHGAIVIPLVNKVDRWKFLAEAQERFGWFITSPFSAPVVGGHPLAIEGYKTIAYEIIEQRAGEVPDWCVMPVCYGDALSGVWAGFRSSIATASSTACQKWLRQRFTAHCRPLSLEEPITFWSRRFGSTLSPFRLAHRVVRTRRSRHFGNSSGQAVPVSNDGLIDMQSLLARREGIFAELASVTPLMAIRTLADRGLIATRDSVVAVVTAGGLKDLDRSAPPEARYETFDTTADAWNWF